MNENIVLGVRVTKNMRKQIEELVKQENYFNISDFVREAIRAHVKGWHKQQKEEEGE